MMTHNELELLRDQGPTPEIPPLDAILHRANKMKRRAHWRHLTALVAIAAVIVAGVVVEPWNGHTRRGVASADVLAAIDSNLGCEGTARRATPAEADAVRFLPAYVPSGFTIDDAFTNHQTDFACFRFFARAVYARRTGPNLVAATLTISTGSEPVARLDCGLDNGPTPVDAPPSDFQRCVQVRGHSGALLHSFGTTSVAWIEPGVGAVDVHATALSPETLLAFVNRLTTVGSERITAPEAAVPRGYAIAYENWDQFRELTDHNDFRGTYVHGRLPSDDLLPQLWITVTPMRRALWALLPSASGFDLVNVQGHEGFVYDTDDGGVSVNWKVGDSLFSVNAPPGVARADALRVARSVAPVARDDPRLIDPSTRN